MSYRDLLCSLEEGGVAVVTLNRPGRRNALSLNLMREIIACLDELGRNREVRVVVIAGAGRVFCAGHDLSEMTGRTVTEYREIFDVCTDLMLKVQAIPQPVIARVDGVATAAGCQLVATCDLAVASTDASFATPGVRIGLFCTTPMVALTRTIGAKRAFLMLATGEAIDAATALEWGLVNRVAPAAELDATVREMASRIAASSSLVMGLGKAAFHAQADLDREKAYAYAKEVMTMNALAADAQEGISAFIEKRAPCWTGR